MTMLGRLAAPAAAEGCLDLERFKTLEKDGGLIQLDGKDTAAQLGELRDFIRDGIASSDERLAELFWQGRDVVELVHARAWVVEQMLLLAWKKLVPYLEGVGLLAVGGYGRGELHPHSDVDLLILLGDDIGDQLPREEIEAFVQLLWDAGFYLGHAVRTVFLTYVFDYFVSSFSIKIDIYIRHGYPFRIQEPFKNQVII